MAFFNKKEEVLDFQLTEYGKRLLEQGNLKPALYSFFDDDILYDLEAGSFNGSVENQNSADRRIKYETPNLKVQKHTTGAETRVNQFLEEVSGRVSKKAANSTEFLIAENSVEFVNAFQDTPQFAQKFFLGSDPIGSSDLKSSYGPAWQINCLANEISSSQSYLTTNLTSSGNPGLAHGIVRKIPQLDITIDYKTFYLEPENLQDYEDPVVKNIVSLGTSPDGTIALYVEENYLVLDISEANTGNLKENFDIEVFEQHGKTAGTDPLTYTRKMFIGADGETEVTNNSQVEHYLNIMVDQEIPSEVLSSLQITDNMIKGSSVRSNLSRNLYTTDNEEPC
tara:strand:- start:2525 stop:3538 length:1014 start_codon:yes stop_codon:yes gene_type:complete